MSKLVDDAISNVMAAVKRLAKEDRNAHGGYNFAGIDDFLEMTGKLCAAAKLNVMMDEETFEVIPEFFNTKQGKVAALHMRFAITLASGGEEKGPYRRSIMVPANMGSQAFGAGQSYVLKQFLRATFQIPTGDKGEDIDAHDTGTMTPRVAEQSQPNGTNWGGRYPTKTALHRALVVHQAEINRLGVEGTFDDLDNYLTSPEYADFVVTAEEHAPHYLDGPRPDSVPEEFIQTFALEKKARDLIALRGNVAG